MFVGVIYWLIYLRSYLMALFGHGIRFLSGKIPESGVASEKTLLSLFLDYYELTMGKADLDHGNNAAITENYFVRKIPFGSYLIAVGLEQFIHYVMNLEFAEDDLNWLKQKYGRDFDDKFLDYLRNFRFRGDIYVVPEGTLMFPYEPIINVTGPTIDVQLFETYLLNIINFQSLIATKASRIVYAARGRMVIDFGARRAHGRDAAILAARAAYIGGAMGTSLVVASKIWDIPAYGTMAHKFVEDRVSEVQAFRDYAESFPRNTMLLLDTYDTLRGARVACEVGKELRKKGFDLQGVRLDSGDITTLSKEVRKILDEKGFKATKILASGDLDEFVIEEMLGKGAPIDAFGVGTRLTTGSCYDPITGKGGVSALGGIFKLAERVLPDGSVVPKMKFSEEPDKTTLPGRKQVYRLVSGGKFVKDLIASWSPKSRIEPEYKPLLVPIMRDGKLVYRFPSLREVREYAAQQIEMLPDQYKKLRDAPEYPVMVSDELTALVERIRRDHEAME